MEKKKEAMEEPEDEEVNKGEEEMDEDKREAEKGDSESEDDEDEDDEAKKKKKKKQTNKGELGGESPSESAASGNDANSTISPNAGVPSTQQVLVGNSGVVVGRNASTVSMGGQSPSDISYSGKSANPDLMKSPLYVELSKGLSSMQEAISKKLDAVEKSFNDRIANMAKQMDAIEKFYSNPLYKAVNEETNPEAVQKQSITEQLAKGKVLRSY